MSDREKVIDRIRKLRALAEDGSVNNEEAAAAAAMKMAKLMQEHAVQEHELADPASLERVGHDFQQKYFDQWRRWLIGECALTCGAKPIYFRKARPPFVRVYGRPTACLATWEMFKFIEGQVVRISREMYSVTKDQRQAQKGLALGVAEKLHDHRQADQDNPANLPVVLEAEMAEEAAFEAEPSLRTMKKKAVKWTYEAENGRRNADRVNLREILK